METSLIILTFALIILVFAADYFVDAAISLANNLKIPSSIIALTIIGFGSSIPELAIGIFSRMDNHHDLIFGNVIGSNIINIFLIVGLAILINPFRVKVNTIRKEIPILLLVTIATTILAFDKAFDVAPLNHITRGDGFILLLIFGIFLYYLIHLFRRRNKNADTYDKPKYSLTRSSIYLVVSFIFIFFASSQIVDHAVVIAQGLGISEKIIALTVIVFGTSLPDIIITINAAKKRESDFIIGNIIGTNIFNLCIVLGIPAVLFGGIRIVSFSLVDMFFANLAVVTLLLFSYSDKKLERQEGLLLVIGFILYYSYVFFG